MNKRKFLVRLLLALTCLLSVVVVYAAVVISDAKTCGPRTGVYALLEDLGQLPERGTCVQMDGYPAPWCHDQGNPCRVSSGRRGKCATDPDYGCVCVPNGGGGRQK